MPFGSTALGALDDVSAIRSALKFKLVRIVARDRVSRVIPPESRNDLADMYTELERLQELIEVARKEVAALYATKIGK